MVLPAVLLPLEVNELLNRLSMEAVILVELSECHQQRDALINQLASGEHVATVGLPEVLADLRQQINCVLDAVNFILLRLILGLFWRLVVTVVGCFVVLEAGLGEDALVVLTEFE